MEKNQTAREIFGAFKTKKGGALEKYATQKQKIKAYKPTNRKEKQIKALAIYCLKIRQRNSEAKRKIKMNPLLKHVANAPDIITAIERLKPADFKELKKAVINWAQRGKNKEIKKAILTATNSRRRLYRDYENKKSKARRIKEDTTAPELESIKDYNLKKRAVRDAEQMREYIIKEHAKTGTFTRRGNTTGVYNRLKARKQYGQRTKEGELMNARQRARKITARPDYEDNRTEDKTRQRANKGEMMENLIKDYTARAIDKRLNEQQKTARKWYTRKKKTTRPPLFDRNPIKNAELVRTATERHNAELLQQRQLQAINRAVNNRSKKHSTEEERRERARRCKNNRTKARALAIISAKL